MTCVTWPKHTNFAVSHSKAKENPAKGKVDPQTHTDGQKRMIVDGNPKASEYIYIYIYIYNNPSTWLPTRLRL